MGSNVKYFLACLLSGAVSTTLLSTPALADQQDFAERLMSCKETVSVITRTQCYDNAIDDYDLNTLKKRTNTGANEWKLETRKSPMTDILNVTLTLASNDLFTTKDGSQVRRFLILSCNEGKPNAYINWNTEFGKPEGTVNTNSDNIVNFRLGADAVVAERWAISTDKTASFIPKPADFINKLVNAKGVYAVTIWPSIYYETMRATFNVDGLANKIKPLKDSCHLP